MNSTVSEQGVVARAMRADEPARSADRPRELQREEITLRFHDDPAALAENWRKLETHGVCTLFQSYKWISAWCRHAAHAEGEQPLISAGYDSTGRTAIIWPLAIVRRFGVPTLTWLGQSRSSYNFGLYRRDIADRLDGDAIRRLLAEIAREYPGICVCELTNQPEAWDGLENPFRRLGAQPSSVRAYERALDPDFERLYADISSSRSRSTLRRKERKLADHGDVRIGLAETREDRAALMATFMQQKSLQFREQGIRDRFAAAHIRGFYMDLFAGEVADSSAQCSSIAVGDENAATFSGISFRDRFYYLSSSMAPGELKRYSPGLILMRETIARQCRAGISHLDLGPGDGDHKEFWKGSPIPLFETHLAFRPRGWPIAAARSAATSVKRAIKDRPALLNAARGIRQLGRSILCSSPKPANAPDRHRA